MIHSESGRRLALLQRDGYACRLCGRSGSVADLTILRLGPLTASNVDGPDALLTACAKCASETPQRPIGDFFLRGPQSSPAPVRRSIGFSDG